MLSVEQAYKLENADSDQILALRRQASALRDMHWGDVVTYSRKVFVPLTNMCRDTCGYCTFVKAPGSPDAHIMSPEEVMDVVRKGEALGCKEVLFSLGEKPEKKYPEARQRLAELGYSTMVDYLQAMCQMVIEHTSMLPHVNAGTLSEEDVIKLRPVSASMGMMLENVSRRLMEKGQAHYACPDKVPVQRLRTLELTGKHNVPFTTGILIGIGETWQERVDSLLAINEIHQRYGHIQEVIVQNFRAKPGTAMADWPEPDQQDMLKTLAVARLILDPTISLQAPPNLQEHYKDYIFSGINDWGGVSPLTIDHINPERAWPKIKALEFKTSESGYRLQERLAIYPQYKNLPEKYLAQQIATRVDSIESQLFSNFI
ncbi:7,8-didemethyl-8-hydroxy-5-deazariboflavin synthase CofG [Neptuniibacter halophilus]|uniref:7,8-didemethyl-8-hydroxy-5-deazariboflavin synthase CofG n=1 Tax=Neptuniibacter halophilus TaxID=651666 RepID=UPI0025740443|nr:7,8-didemethyl-8-hydroxy-5-deazariboflavin synthase CofG [Neptuniibacter halophilus]